MNALELNLPGVTARIENGLLLEFSGPDQLCGRAVLFAYLWSRDVDKLDKKNQERAIQSQRPNAYLLALQTAERLARGNH